MIPPKNPAVPLRLRRLRHAEMAALLATTPAFYLALLDEARVAVVLLYGVAALLAALRGMAEPPTTYRVIRLAGWVLTGALAASALVPLGYEPSWVSVRLAAAALSLMRMAETLRPWLWRGGLPYLVSLAVAIMILCGLGFWWLEPRVHTFGEGLWLAFTTAATVGYGDIVPSTPAAKIFSVFVVLLGLGVLSLLTAAIAATWVQTEERKIEHELLRDLHHELGVIRAELAALRAAQAAAEAGSRGPAATQAQVLSRTTSE